MTASFTVSPIPFQVIRNTEQLAKVSPTADTPTPFRVIRNTEQLGKSSPTADNMNPLPPTFVPGPNCVICARGNTVKKHPGNIRFLQILENNLQKYAAASSKVEKTLIVSSIIDSIKDSCYNGVGFVRQVDGQWFVVEDSAAREKAGQRLRDFLSGRYQSSSKSKKRRRRANEAILASRVDDIVARSNGKALADRIEELTPAGLSSKGDNESFAEFQKIFDQANSELLQRIKAEEANSSTFDGCDESEHSCGDKSSSS